MKTSTARAVLQEVLQRTATDWVWGSLGMGVAAASASFAAYMLIVGPGRFGLHGSPDFGVFAHMGPRTGPVAPVQATASLGPSQAAAPRPPEARQAPTNTAGIIDFSPTGSVETKRAGDKSAPLAGPTIASGKNAPLTAFILRDVFDGKALVESRKSLTLVEPGSMIDGAGQVLSIERRGDAWVVNTTQGVIGAPSR